MTSKNAGGETYEIMRRVTVDFFDRTLRGSTYTPTLDTPPWPHVHIDHRDGSAAGGT